MLLIASSTTETQVLLADDRIDEIEYDPSEDDSPGERIKTKNEGLGLLPADLE
jgi:hypothetical protein